MRISDWSSDVCSSDLRLRRLVDAPMRFRQADLRVRAEVEALFEGQRFDAVVHFAALKAVGESCERPLDYFDNNISGTIHLLQAMRAAGVNRLVFRSSATGGGRAHVRNPVTKAHAV